MHGFQELTPRMPTNPSTESTRGRANVFECARANIWIHTPRMIARVIQIKRGPDVKLLRLPNNLIGLINF